MTKPKIGEIWLAGIPIVRYDENNDIYFQIQNRL